MKKLVLRVHTQRVLLKGLYHMALMGFKWQTRTKVFHGKPSCFVNSYKVAPIYIRTKKYRIEFQNSGLFVEEEISSDNRPQVQRCTA